MSSKYLRFCSFISLFATIAILSTPLLARQKSDPNEPPISDNTSYPADEVLVG